jgi:hypothetical protein
VNFGKCRVSRNWRGKFNCCRFLAVLSKNKEKIRVIKYKSGQKSPDISQKLTQVGLQEK